MIYTTEVQHMCPVAKGAYHGPAPIPEEGKWVQAKEISDISGFTHGIGWCAPQQGACKLTLNIKNGIIEEALVETIGCSGMTHSAAMASEILIGKTVVAEAGSAGETTITENADLSQADFISKAVQTDCLMEVAAGTADAAILDLTLASAMIGEGTDYANLKMVDELNVEEYGVAFRKDSDVAEAVDNAFDELKADGTMQALADKYGLTLAE